MNNVTLVGRLTNDPEVKENSDGTYRTIIKLFVSRDYKNPDGVYEADYIYCVLWNGIASATKNYCHKGDVVGVKGRLQSKSYENDKNEKKYTLEVVVDKVSFIATSDKKE